MQFHSIDFLVFFPMAVLIFFVMPRKMRTLWLLIASCYFYISWNPRYAVWINVSTVIAYTAGLMIEKSSSVRRKKLVVAFALLSNLGILAVFKYADFAIETFNSLCSFAGLGVIEKRLDLLLPLGISFYTFQTAGYIIDVYRGNVPAEKNILNFALFVSFFPHLVSGPIERSGSFLKQIRELKNIQVWDFERVKDGLMLMLWGIFQKLVIADRAALLVNQVFTNYQNYGFIEIAIAAILFAFQIYCDFGGYTNTARGAAQVLGFSIAENFRQPYLAVSIKDFWRRWHISLTSWFTDYLYIPLGGNRKGLIRKYINIFIVFGVSGLWHGASWHFVAWGLLHAVYQVAGDVKKKIEEKRHLNNGRETISKRIRKAVTVFILVDIGWVFFAADSVRHAFCIFRQMFTGIIKVSVFELGLDRGNWTTFILAAVLLLVIDVLHERGTSISKIINSQEIWFRYLIYAGLIWSIIMFGIYGTGYDTSSFIYVQF